MEVVKVIFYAITLLTILLAPVGAIGWIIYRLIKSSGNNNSIKGN